MTDLVCDCGHPESQHGADGMIPCCVEGCDCDAFDEGDS